jgi:hypothetical protein
MHTFEEFHFFFKMSSWSVSSKSRIDITFSCNNGPYKQRQICYTLYTYLAPFHRTLIPRVFARVFTVIAFRISKFFGLRTEDT